MASKKNKSFSVLTLALIFIALSFYLVSNMDFSSNKLGEVEAALKEISGEELTGETITDKLIYANKLGNNIELVPTKYIDYLPPVFGFVIKDNVIITDSYAKDFYTYGFAIGDILLKVDNLEIKGTVDEIYALLFSNKIGEEKTFTVLRNNIEVTIKHKYKVIYDNDIHIEVKDDNLFIKPFYLDNKIVTKLSLFKGEYENITIDLSTCNTLDPLSVASFLNLFIDGDLMLFKVNGYKTIEELKCYSFANAMIIGKIELINYNNLPLGGDIIATILNNHFKLNYSLVKNDNNKFPLGVELTDYVLYAKKLSWEVLLSGS